MKITGKNLLLVVTIIFVTGALLHRVYPLAGLVVMACALVFYLVFTAKRTFRIVRDFPRSDSKSKALTVVWAGMLLITVNVFWVMFRGGGFSYFFVLVLLAADFLLQKNDKRNEKK